MEQFDAIVPSNSNSNNGGYVTVPRPGPGWTAFSTYDGGDDNDGFDPTDMYLSKRKADAARQRRLCIYGAFAGAFVVVVVMLSLIHRDDSSKTKSSTPSSSSSNSPYDTSSTAPFTFAARHPLAGEYHDAVEMYIREDISSLSPGVEAETEITTIVETTKTVRDLAQQQKQWDIVTTRLSTDMAILGQVTHCDTKDMTDPPPPACLPLVTTVGTTMSFVIAANGTVLSEVDTDAHGHITKNARTTAGGANAVETLDNNLLYLPPKSTTVKIGDEWDSRFALSSVGDFAGKTTFAGTTRCDAKSATTTTSKSSKKSKSSDHKMDNNACAVLTSTGTIYMDVQAMADRFGSLGIDPTMLSIEGGKSVQTLYWNDDLAYFAYCETILDFTIKLTIPGADPPFRIPVHERITIHTTLAAP